MYMVKTFLVPEASCGDRVKLALINLFLKLHKDKYY